MSDWTVQRIEALAPDAAAVRAAHGVAKPGNWSGTGRTGTLVWGECKGSGATPYQVRVDLDDGAYKCSCPSRKLPCKHTLGLLLLMAAGAVVVHEGEGPGFVTEWTANRARRTQARAAKPAADRPPDPAAQARRIEKRESRIGAGLDQLDVWLQDVMAHGLAAARVQPPEFWEQIAARLVDAQAPGLARRVRELGEIALGAKDWQDALLAGLARLQLVIDAYRRLDALPPALAAEVRSAVGWTQSQDALLDRAGTFDRWQVIGRRQSANETLRTQSTWFWGRESGRMALLLEFAVGREPLPTGFAVGQVVAAELVFFDGEPPLRAIVKRRDPGVESAGELPGAGDVSAVQRELAARLAATPWLERWPVVLGPVVPRLDAGSLALVDAVGRSLPVRASFRHAWHLVALASGDPITVFGEWDGRTFDPITAARGGALYTPSAIGELSVLAQVSAS